MAAPGFWDDPPAAQRVMREVSALQGVLDRWAKLEREAEDLQVLCDLAGEAGDEGEAAEVERTVTLLSREVERWELDLLLDGEYDNHQAILAIHPGAGGTEAQDWAEMLLRMYTRWAEERGYKMQVLDFLPGDEAGIKSVTLSVEGPNAYGYLKAEKGVHRLVRISPFDQAARRHTSFASVEVLPQIEDEHEIELDPQDLRIDTYRSGGAGGQHVNKTESAIRITHLPTGIVVTCQNERSQFSNRDTAMRILQARLLERRLAEQQERLAELRGEHSDIAWGSQIRSYVFCPYTMVKDHRTNHETGNVQAVMDGELDPFIDAYLRQQKQRRA
jgi:peptide chain release factor 2